MNREQVVGMFVGAFLGDMLGAPYEFEDRLDAEDVKLTTGGAHSVSLGEYTDDGALTLALGESYVARGYFDAEDAARRFKQWALTGKYGTRDYVFDIGTTTSNAINRMRYDDVVYAAVGNDRDSGNGSLMRIAACIAANHTNPMRALADTVAASLMTHGNSDILEYTTAFVDELMNGASTQYSHLKCHPEKFANARGTIMYAYNAARHALHHGGSDGGAVLRHAVSFGYDTDTNACIAGMWVGAKYGIDCFPKEYVDALQNKKRIFEVANKLFDIGASK
jgi:ADP-ribosyl-[dinitrogen reductase] hydrolase